MQSPAKAVYNARHWNQPEPEEVSPPASSHTVPGPVSKVLHSQPLNCIHKNVLSAHHNVVVVFCLEGQCVQQQQRDKFP